MIGTSISHCENAEKLRAGSMDDFNHAEDAV